MSSRRTNLAILLGWISIAPLLRAQESAAGLLGMAPLPASPPIPARIVHQPARDFVIGRDNLGFANPSGALSVPGLSGNCYAMAAVAKLFHEAGDYRPDERMSPSVDAEQLAESLRSPAYPWPPFPVRGFESLYQLSTAPEGARSEAWMEGWARYQVGLAATPPEGPMPDNVDAATGIYQLVTMVHYLHYMRFQGDNLLESVIRRSLEGSPSVAQVAARSLGRIRELLDGGHLAMVAVFNPRPEVFMGHVLLVYRQVEVPSMGYTDLYVYDSNLHFARSRRLPESPTDEAFVRVHSDGRLEIKAETAGGVIHDVPVYAGDAMIEDAEAAMLLVLDDPEGDASLRGQLADQVPRARHHAGYLLATGDLVDSLTQHPPGESNLFEDVRGFVRATARVGDSEGIPADATVAELNAFLETHTEEAVRLVFPMVLPEGLAVRDVELRFDEADPNRAWLQSTLTLSRSASLDAVLEVLHQSALVDDEEVASLLQSARRAFEGQILRLRTRLRVEKGEPHGRLGRYGPVVTLQGTHLVVGDLDPGSMAPGDDHRIEIAEEVVQSFVHDLLTRRGVVGARIERRYQVPTQGTRTGYVRLDDVVVDSRPSFYPGLAGRLGIRVAYHGFAAVTSESDGIFLSSRYTSLWLQLQPSAGRNMVRVSGRVSGSHRIETGLDWIPFVRISLDVALSTYFRSLFEDLRGFMGELLEGELARHVTLHGPGPRFRDLEVDSEEVSLEIDGFEVDVEQSLARVMGFAPGEIPVHLTGIELLHDRVVVRLANDRRE